MAVTGLVYLFGTATRLAGPEFAAAYEPVFLWALVTEIAFCLWLVRIGLGRGAAATA